MPWILHIDDTNDAKSFKASRLLNDESNTTSTVASLEKSTIHSTNVAVSVVSFFNEILWRADEYEDDGSEVSI